MTRKILVLALFLWPLAAGADLTLTGHSTVGSLGTTLAQEERLLIHDNWLRRDFTDRGKAYSHLYDLARRQVVMMDHSFRYVEIYDMAALNTVTQVSAPTEKLDLSVTPTGRKNKLQAWTCVEHAVSSSMPALLGNEWVTFILKGTVWLASGVPEQVSVKALVQAAQDPAFFLAIPTAVRVAPAQARGISEIIRRLAPKGLPCMGEVDFTFEGTGPMANLARKMPSRLGVQYRAYSAEPISKDAFAIPAGYSVVRR